MGTRDIGGDADFILPLRERIKSGATLGPEIVTSGADPTLDIRNTDKIAAVILRGKLLTKPALDGIIARHRRKDSLSGGATKAALLIRSQL